MVLRVLGFRVFGVFVFQRSSFMFGVLGFRISGPTVGFRASAF